MTQFPQLFSTRAQLDLFASIVAKYMQMPFSGDSIHGDFVEETLACIKSEGKKSGEEIRRLGTYDYIDILDQHHGLGWQVKATKADTPVTWKRAKIPNKTRLIKRSQSSAAGRRALGKAIIEFCNGNIIKAIDKYKLKAIGYCRVIVYPNRIRYFERFLTADGNLFNHDDFTWAWSKQKDAVNKEQLPAFHGMDHRGRKMWAWHGLSENQLHFCGESQWWNFADLVNDTTIPLPQSRMSMREFADLKL